MGSIANIDFRFYVALFKRRLPLFLTVVALVGAVCVALAVLWPVSYQATAKILVESPQIPTDLAKSTVPTGAAEQFQIIQEDVLSRRSLLALAEQFGIYAGRSDLTSTDMADDMMRRLDIVPIPIGTGSGTGATVFQISFKADRPDTAANLVNELVSLILKKDVELRTARATETVSFFNEETQRLNSELRDLDGRILAFKNDNINALPDSIDFRRNQQTNQQDRLLALTQEEASLRKRQTALQSRPLESINAGPTTPEEQNLQALRQSLAQQQALFDDSSPTIQTLRTRIASLESSLLASNAAGPATTGPLSSRDAELLDISDRLAEIQQERTLINTAVSDLTASIDATPGNETVLNSLQRDHQNLQAQYDSAIARLAEASTGQQIELLLKGERLSLIDSAVPPQVPQGPRQKVLLLASAIAALLAGLAVVIVPELLNRRIRRPAELVSRLQIAPYITVPYIERRRFFPLRTAMRLSMILLLPALLLATQLYSGPIQNLVAFTSNQQ